jgi:hypothetical protein
MNYSVPGGANLIITISGKGKVEKLRGIFINIQLSPFRLKSLTPSSPPLPRERGKLNQ